jgi:hypothetical protein
MGIADSDAKSVNKGVPAISVIPIKKKAAPDSIILVD